MNITYTTVIIIFLISLASYLFGSLSSAILISKIKKLPDPRSYGSGNPGTSNIFRQQGIKIATTVLLFDILKGIIPIWIAQELHISPIGIEIIGTATCLGHIYPIFFHFCGGKGVAISFGILAAIKTDIALVAISIWGISVLISGYASLGAVITSLVTPLYIWWIYPKFTALAITLSLLILIKHLDNITRLYKNQEKRIWK